MYRGVSQLLIGVGCGDGMGVEAENEIREIQDLERFLLRVRLGQGQARVRTVLARVEMKGKGAREYLWGH